MSRSWILDSRGFARKVKGGSLPSEKQIKDCGAKRECPKCHFLIDNSDVSHEWPGLPVGVKFDPADIEILEHLAAKCRVGNSEPHMFINEFIPTIDAEGGICHKHPEELPGSRKDGSSVHFFHKTINAYTTGQRKRRKIRTEPSSTKENVRWHKTGKTKPVIENGVQKGCKKIMVLYGASVKGSKPEKTNWVMHQYHLGTDEDEKEGQYVVSKIFYQVEKADKYDNIIVIEDTDVGTIQNIPKPPKTPTINPPRPVTSKLCGDATNDYAIHSPVQQSELIKNTSHSLPSHTENNNDMEHPSRLGGDDELLLCDENFDSYVPLGGSKKSIGSAGYTNLRNMCQLSEFDSQGPDSKESFGSAGYTNLRNMCQLSEFDSQGPDTPSDFQLSELELIKNSSHYPPSHMGNKDDMEHSFRLGGDDTLLCDEIFDSYVPLGDSRQSHGTNCGLSELDSVELDTPQDFQLSDIQFGSQDSIFGW